MSLFEQSYLDILKTLLQAPRRFDRTGVGTRSVFGYHLVVDLSEGYPLLTTKKVHFRSILYELFWFIRGDTNIKYLHDNKVTIWDEWADENGDLGPIYGYQWRRWPGYKGETYDQLKAVIEGIKSDPYSRRLIVSAWNVGQLCEMKLPPCHVLFQLYAQPESKELSMLVYQRSADAFLGLPFNIASYALLLHIIAHITDYKPNKLHFFIGDLHLYQNHEEQAKTQIAREPYPLPQIKINSKLKDIDQITPSDIVLIDYKSHPAIPAPVAV